MKIDAHNGSIVKGMDLKDIFVYTNLYGVILLEDLAFSLIEDGINIYDLDFRYTSRYQKVRYEWVFSDEFDAMSLEECIERLLLSDDQIDASYKSIYDMGNTFKLSPSDCTLSELVVEITENIASIAKLDGADKDEKKTLISDSITRKESGLIERLNRDLALDINSFDKSNEKNLTEIYKILYFFYMLENDDTDYPRIDYWKFLRTPSMENADHSIHNHLTSNGWIFLHISNSLAKEVSLAVKSKIKRELFRVTTEWEAFLIGVSNAINNEPHYDFSGILDALKSIPQEIQKDSKISEHRHSPIETLYLYMKRYEYLGHLNDILNANVIQTTKNDYNIPIRLIKKLQNIAINFIADEGINDYLKINILDIVDYVHCGASKYQRQYLRDIIKEKTLEDKRRYSKLLDEIKELLEYLRQHKKQFFNGNREFSEVLLISCLQAIILDNVNEEYKFFRSQAERLSQEKNKKIRIQSELGYQCPYYGVQVVWVRKVMDRYNANLGMYDARIQVRGWEVLIDDIKSRIFKKQNLDVICKLHDKYVFEASETFKQLFSLMTWRQLVAEGFEKIERKCDM